MTTVAPSRAAGSPAGDDVRNGTLLQGGLVAYLDLGRSFGLGDSAFRPEVLDRPTSIGDVGITNPLGRGTTVDLLVDARDVVATWRREAQAQLGRKELETGWTSALGVTEEAHRQRLAAYVTAHPVRRCRLTLFAVGIVVLEFELEPGVDLGCLRGVLTCFEFAGYRPEVADALWRCVLDRAEQAAVDPSSHFTELTRRSTGHLTADDKGYQETDRFTSFTRVVTYLAPASRGPMPAELVDVWAMRDDPVIEFEYHGILRYSWGTCLLQPRGHEEWTPEVELSRIHEDLRIAHAAVGVCEALLHLAREEVTSQVESFVSDDRHVRSSSDLNRLRTLALAVVNVTDLSRVADSEEDRQYFTRFAGDATLEDTKRLLGDSLELLYQVQEAAAQEERARRDWLLNSVVVVLASLTLISVSADAYDFIRDQEPLVSGLGQRVRLFLQFVIVVALLVIIFFRATREGRRPRAHRRQRRPRTALGGTRRGGDRG